MQPFDPVVITGAGMVTPLGADTASTWNAVIAKKCAIESWHDLEAEGFKHTYAARIHIELDPLTRGTIIAAKAISEALEQAAVSSVLREHASIVLGTTMGESFAFEQVAEGAQLDLKQYSGKGIANRLKAEFAFGGQALCTGTACAAGNYAIGVATAMLEADQTGLVIAGATEPFSRIAHLGFSRSRAMAAGYCNPFDKNRTGMILGEGAAFFVMEKLSHALARRVRPLALVGSLGLCSDAHHLTAPDASGNGMLGAMAQALDQQKLTPNNVSWVCGHGSGTMANDDAESKAITALFDENITVSFCKGALGHSLGAASAIETGIVLKSLAEDMVPPATGCNEPISEAAFDIARDPKPMPVQWVLNTAFAFGGLNSALLLGKYHAA